MMVVKLDDPVFNWVLFLAFKDNYTARRVWERQS